MTSYDVLDWCALHAFCSSWRNAAARSTPHSGHRRRLAGRHRSYELRGLAVRLVVTVEAVESICHTREGAEFTRHPVQIGVRQLRAPAGRGEDLGLLRVHQATYRQIQNPAVRQLRRDQRRGLSTRWGTPLSPPTAVATPSGKLFISVKYFSSTNREMWNRIVFLRKNVFRGSIESRSSASIQRGSRECESFASEAPSGQPAITFVVHFHRSRADGV